METFCQPAAVLASFFLGCPVLEAEAGYVLVHPQLDVRVVEACGGFDFFALHYAVLLAFAVRHRRRWGWAAVRLLPLSYLVTLAANSARIVCAVYMRILTETLPVGLPDEVVHLALGAGIFATFLAACCQAARTFYEHDAKRSLSIRA